MQVDIQTFLNKSQWKHGEGFLIPAHLTKLSVLDVAAAVFITHEEVFGKRYSKEEFKNDLSQFTTEDSVILISKILTVMENEGRLNASAQKSLAQELFAGVVREKILRTLNTQSDRVVFFESQLLLVAKYAILYAKNEPANDFMGKKLYPLFMKIILGVTDLLDIGRHDVTEMQRVAIRNMYFDSKPSFFYSIGRTEDLFIHIPIEIKTHPQYLDIAALFQEATGFSIEDYLLLGTSLTAPFIQQKLNQAKEGNWGINPKVYFAKSNVSNIEIDLLMKEFAIDIKTLQALYSSQENFEFNFNGLVQHPLVTFEDNNVFFPLDFSFLKDKVTLQVYWIIFDHIKRRYDNRNLATYEGKKLHQYTNFMGACFEEYVYRLLKRVYPSSIIGDRLVRELTYIRKKSEVKTVDNILINQSSLILIETKISQLNVYSTGIVGDLDAFRKDIKKIVVDAFKTIQRTKEDFQKGLLKNDLLVDPRRISMFYPVVITYGKFIMFPIVWTIVVEEIKKVPNYDPELLNSLQIIQADEIELIEALLSTGGISFEQLLSRKIADRVFKTLPFHNFINHEFSGRTRLVSKYQEQQYAHFMERIKLRILDQIPEEGGI
jgi:hypothetical protein